MFLMMINLKLKILFFAYLLEIEQNKGKFTSLYAFLNLVINDTG